MKPFIRNGLLITLGATIAGAAISFVSNVITFISKSRSLSHSISWYSEIF